MKINFTEKDISILKVVSQISLGFALLVAMTMIFTFVQLKIMKPLDSPILSSIKEQYDKDPAEGVKAEQIRAMDLMARKAYFSSRWQVETGSYLLIAGIIVFVLCQRIISDNEKPAPVLTDAKPDAEAGRTRNRKFIVATVSIIFISAVVSSFLLRASLPDLARKSQAPETNGGSGGSKDVPVPDKNNWPSFRGQNSQGIAGGSDYPTEWDGESGKNIGWKIEVPGRGKSSPVIWGDKLFITGARDRICEVYCIDKTNGKIMWTGNASDIAGEPSELPKTDAEAGLAVSTMVTNGKAVYAVFANGNLVCFDIDGNKKWAKNIGVPESSYGYSSSLLIYQNNLLLQYDSNKKISLMAFDTETGDQKWETLRKGHAVWSSPVLASFNGIPELIINGNPNVSSFDPSTGKALWDLECMSGDVAPSVAVNSTMTYAVTDYAKLVAIKPGSTPTITWEDNTFTPDVSSPVATDKFLFLSTGNGDAACYNAFKGDTVWTHYFQNPFYSSPIVADGKVYYLDRGGKMHIVNAEAQFKLIAESSLGEATDCSPAFSDKHIFIRGKKNLYCIKN
jgi:outer membrane protein assembly factor BamB